MRRLKEKLASFKMPHTYVILTIILLAVVVMCYLIPAGEYDRVEDPVSGREVVVPGSYHEIDVDAPGIFDLFLALQQGYVALVPSIGGVQAKKHGFKQLRPAGIQPAAREALVYLFAQPAVSHIQHPVETYRSVAYGTAVYKRNSVLSPLYERRRTYYQLSRKYPKRRVFLPRS